MQAGWVTAGALAALVWAAAPGRAQVLGDADDGPVCRRPEVLDVVARELRRRIVYADFDPRAVWEQPAAEPDAVECSLCLQVRVYDEARYGEPPAARCELHRYEVERLRVGFRVRSVD